ncbi:hypothetical protein GJ496_000779 [Pomphorhynchus laevis]|nr:hypothetical protein GJ496_000779 [Pomphorhynchus laevis]
MHSQHQKLKKFTVFCTYVFILISIDPIESSQKFIRKPKNVSAIIGSNIIFECSVQVPHGDVQWTKNFTAMGFSRDLPAYARYSVIGNADKGQHDLHIRSVNLADEGVYSCEVSKFGNKDHLQAHAFLNVIVPPASVTINGSEQHQFLVKSDEKVLILECKVLNSKPAVNLSWSDGDSQIINDVKTVNVFNSQSLLTTTVSYLTLHISKTVKARDVYCSTTSRIYSHQKMAKASISVIWLPDKLTLTIFPQKSWLIEGDHFELVCNVSGGNPKPKIKWSKNNKPISSYRSKRESAQTISKLNLVATASDHSAIYQCYAETEYFDQQMKKSMQLNVYYGPNDGTMFLANSTVDGSKLILPLINGSYRVSCRSIISNPKPSTKWLFNNDFIGKDHSDYLELVPMKNLSNGRLTCTLSNPKSNHFISITKIIEIPQALKIIGPKSPLTVGMDLNLKCIAVDGFPNPELYWTRGDIRLKSVSSYNKEMGKSVELLKLSISKNDHLQEFKCNALIPGYLLMFKPVNAQFQTVVYFQPDSLHILDFKKIYNISEELKPQCQSSPSNPATTLRMSIILPNNTKLEGSIISSSIKSDRFGQITTTVFSFGAMQQIHHLTKLECIGETLISHEQLYIDISSIILINHYPYFDEFVPHTVNVTEGEDLTLTVRARAYPEAIRFKWLDSSFRELKFTSKSSLDYSRDILKIVKIDRDQSGYFTCEAENQIGKNRHSIFVNVLYGPKVEIQSSMKIMNPGLTVKIICKINANPLIFTNINWFHNSRRINKLKEGQYSLTWLRNSTMILTVFNVTSENSGMYKCSAKNSLGFGHSSIEIFVKSRPSIDRSSRFTKYATTILNTPNNANLECHFKAVPKARVFWKIDDEIVESIDNLILLNASNSKYSSSLESLSNNMFVSKLVIKSVEMADFSRMYRCIAQNELGTDDVSIILLPHSSPSMPTNLQPVNISHRFIHLQWEAGFDGGLTQWFRIRYCDEVKNHCSYEDTTTESTSYILRSLNPGTRYLISMKAINIIGESDWYPEKEFEIFTKEIDSLLYTDGRLFIQTKIPPYVMVILCIISAVLIIFAIAIISLTLRKQPTPFSECSSNTKTYRSDHNILDFINNVGGSASYITNNTWSNGKQQLAQSCGEEDILRPFLQQSPRQLSHSAAHSNQISMADIYSEHNRISANNVYSYANYPRFENQYSTRSGSKKTIGSYDNINE